MKKVLLAIAAVATITSCSQNEEFENPAQKAEIGFNTAAVTRATAMITDNFKEFQVYGYAHSGTFENETEGTSLVNGYYKNDGAGWKENGGKKFYWPSSGNVTFFAYSPVPATDNANPNAVYNTPTDGKGCPTIDYTVVDNIANQEDFLIAQSTGDGTNNKEGVSLAFKHALTQIAFKLKGSDTNVSYSVTKIVLDGIKNSGKYKWGGNSWEVSTTSKEYTVTMTDEAIEFNGDATATELTGNDKVLMLIPQAPSNAKIHVTYTAKGKALDGTTDIVYCNNETKSVEVPTTQWVAGNRIIFTIALSPGNTINISGSVDTWKDSEVQPDDLETK